MHGGASFILKILYFDDFLILASEENIQHLKDVVVNEFQWAALEEGKLQS